MRVGVDARLLSLPLTGIGRYTLQMLIALQQHPHELFVYSPQPLLQAIRPQLNKSVTVRVARAKGRIGRMIWSQTTLSRWAKEDEIDVFWGATHRLPAFLPKHMAKVVTIHDLVYLYAGDTMRPTSRLLEKILLPKAIVAADSIIADSHSTGESIKSVFPQSAHKVNVIHLGAGLAEENFPHARSNDFLEKNALGIKTPYILFVGTIEPRKNLIRLLNAFAGLPAELRNKHQLVIAGGKGWGEINLQRALRDFDLTAEVCVVDFVDDAVLYDLYANALFLAMPSLYEGFGLPLLEAMRLGKPVLTSDNSSMPEIAGAAGYYINPHSTDSIREGLCVLLTDSDRYLQLSAQARKIAGNFSWDKAAIQASAVFATAYKTQTERT